MLHRFVTKYRAKVRQEAAWLTYQPNIRHHQREQAAIDAFVLETCEGAVRTAKGMAL